MATLSLSNDAHGDASGGCSPTTGRWPLERVLFAMAGTVALLSAVLAAAISPWFLLLTAFVGVNQLLFAGFGVCAASLVLTRLGLVPTAKTNKGTR